MPSYTAWHETRQRAKVRRQAIKRLLDAGAEIDIADLAAAHGVREFTIYNDIRAIRKQEAGV